MTMWYSTAGRIIILIFTMLIGPLGAAAQQVEKGWRIGWLAYWPDPTLEAFRQGLRELGYVEGKHITIETRYAEDREDRLGALAAELVRLPVDVLVIGAGNPGVRAAKDATSTIPIVFVSGVDPVAAGLITSLAE